VNSFIRQNTGAKTTDHRPQNGTPARLGAQASLRRKNTAMKGRVSSMGPKGGSGKGDWTSRPIRSNFAAGTPCAPDRRQKNQGGPDNLFCSATAQQARAFPPPTLPPPPRRTEAFDRDRKR